MTTDDVQRDIDNEGQRAIPRTRCKLDNGVVPDLDIRCDQCDVGPCHKYVTDADGGSTRPRTIRPGWGQPPGAAWENERVATALRTLADQVQAGDWSGVPNALAILGARMDRRRR